MSDYTLIQKEERKYLQKIITLLKTELDYTTTNEAKRKKDLISSKKDMWENTVHHLRDFTKLSEANHYLLELNIQTQHYASTVKRLTSYQKALSSPYFGRFDFLEDNYDNAEKIYVGLCNITDPLTHEICVYDWRAPISSIFYQYEPGRAKFSAPVGEITGNVLLKRQYKIYNSKLKYFFDCSLKINDAILQEVLSHNTSPKMKNIVETIQREQDLIIRDLDNDLLIVQGTAGSGKTSVALHRVAYLLYHGLNTNLQCNNVIIVSPNTLFSKYISNVLPELGEENIEQITFNALSENLLGKVESKQEQLESLISTQGSYDAKIKHSSVAFKGSKTFKEILDRLLWYWEHRIIQFEDIYVDGKFIETKQQLKNRFFKNKVLPTAKQLQRIEDAILQKVHPVQKKRREKIEEIVQTFEGRDLEIKSFSRLLAIKEAKRFYNNIKKFTRVNFFEVYTSLFNNQKLLLKLANKLNLPEDIDKIIIFTKENLEKGIIAYEDCAALLYLKFKIEGSTNYHQIKQVVIDEAQDYYPLHYEVFNHLFNEAKFTILGDINQTIEDEVHATTIYDDILNIFHKPNSLQLYLNKAYRSSYEINTFTQKILGKPQKVMFFERHSEAPELIYQKTEQLITQSIINDITSFTKQGYRSIAIICKTQIESLQVHSQLIDITDVKLISPGNEETTDGIVVLPSYHAKGLEFDVVIIYNASKERYFTALDKRLLYIVCTRPLHKLKIYYCKEKSPLLP